MIKTSLVEHLAHLKYMTEYHSKMAAEFYMQMQSTVGYPYLPGMWLEAI